jgi:hypothetical protein
MTGARLQASLPWLGFALLGICMALAGGVPAAEVAWAVASVGAALLPSGWVSPSGWRRRAAEALILPAAFALVMVGDPTLRRMILPPLLLLPALAATAAATPRARARARLLLLACLAVAARAACGLGLAGVRWWHVGAVLLGAAAVTWAVGRLAGGAAGTIAALLAGTLPLQSAPLWLPLALLGAAAVAAIVPIRVRADSARVRGWQPGVLASALVVASLAPWGGIAVQRALPAAGWASVAAPLAALAVTPFVPAALSGAVWLSATAALGPLRPPPPDLPATELTAARPSPSPTPRRCRRTHRSRRFWMPARRWSCAPASMPPSGPMNGRTYAPWPRTRSPRGRYGGPQGLAAAQCGAWLVAPRRGCRRAFAPASCETPTSRRASR